LQPKKPNRRKKKTKTGGHDRSYLAARWGQAWGEAKNLKSNQGRSMPRWVGHAKGGGVGGRKRNGGTRRTKIRGTVGTITGVFWKSLRGAEGGWVSINREAECTANAWGKKSKE